MKTTKLLLKLFLLPLALVFTTNAMGQIEYTEEPISSTFNISSSGFALDFTPNFDWEKIADEDDMTQKEGKPLRVGLSVPVNLNINETGEWTQLPDGRMMWRATLKSEGATSLGLVFDRYDLPLGSKLFIYDPDKKNVVGALGNHNNTSAGVLSTRVIPGNTVVIEYVEPHKSGKPENKGNLVTEYKTQATLNIGELIYIYTDAFMTDSDGRPSPGASQYCQVDINCSPVGDDWKDEKRGVVHILLKEGYGYYVCSGSLINNTNEDGTPYFLTAYHCGGSASAADKNQWQFYFNFERPKCGSGTAPQNQVVTGCEMLSYGNISGGSDFLLLLLNENVPETYNPYFNGWSIVSSAPLEAVCIHHPAGDVKKISTSHNISVVEEPVNIGGSTMPANSTWRVHWSKNSNGHGVTEGGSSGSPIFNSYGYIIGTLSGGSSTCAQPNNADFFGRLPYHWQSNGLDAEHSLNSWLDPNNSGITTLKGFDPYRVEQGEVYFTESFEKNKFPPEGWTVESTVESHTWDNSTGYNIGGGISIIAHHGSRFAYVQWHETLDQEEWLITPEIDLTHATLLNFSFFFNGSYSFSVSEDNCDLSVKGRVNGGEWEELWTEHDYQWDEDDNYQWLFVNLDALEQFEGKDNVQFAFVYTGKDGANFNIDQVKLYSSDTGMQGDPSLLKPRNLKAKVINNKDIELTWKQPALGSEVTLEYATRYQMTNVVWPQERATYFDLTDFGEGYPAEINRINHFFYESEGNTWPDNTFVFKIYGADGETELFTSEIMEATHYQHATLNLNPPFTVMDNFFVSVLPTSETGHPSSTAKKVPIGTSHSYYKDEGEWYIYNDSENAMLSYELVTSVRLSSNAKNMDVELDGSQLIPKTKALDYGMIANIPDADIIIPTSKDDDEYIHIGYKVYKDKIAIATILDPAETYYLDQNLVLGTYTYYVTALYENPDAASLPSNEARASIATGIDSDLLKSTLLYPNPFTNTINIANAENISRIVVNNVVGQRVSDIRLKGESSIILPTAGWAKGIYLITLINKEGEYKAVKMVKQ